MTIDFTSPIIHVIYRELELLCPKSIGSMYLNSIHLTNGTLWLEAGMIRINTATWNDETNSWPLVKDIEIPLSSPDLIDKIIAAL